MIPWYLLLPLTAAVIYAAASMLLKKALAEGLHPIASFHINNWACTLVFMPLLFFQKEPVNWAQWHLPLTAGLVFFIGGGFTFIAMRRGDVSLVTPLLGSKLIFVALGSAVFLPGKLPLLMWSAAVITTAGVFLMSLTDLKTPRGSRLAGPVILALISAAFYALSDVLVQQWAPTFGRQAFLAIMAGTTGLLSLLFMRLPGRPILRWSPALRWSLAGSALFGLQVLLTGIALASFNDAVGVNVAFATRGLWLLLMVAAFGPMIGNQERHEAGRAYGLRVLAACLLLVGVICAVMGRMPG